MILPMLINRVNGTWFVLDGKQRCKSVIDFVEGKYVLTGLSNYKVFDKNNKEIDINKKKFAELPIDLQEKILGSTLTFWVYDNLSDTESREMFSRYNNGKSLTSIELNRVKAKGLEEFSNLASHELFTTFLTKKAIEKYKNEDLVEKTWGILFFENISFNTDEFRPLLQTTEVSTEQYETLQIVFDRFLTVCNILESKTIKSSKRKTSRVISMITKPVHFAPLTVVINESIKNGDSISDVANWIPTFFKENTTVSEEYNRLSIGGTGKAAAIKSKVEILRKSYSEIVKKGGN